MYMEVPKVTSRRKIERRNSIGVVLVNVKRLNKCTLVDN